ncbi:MAG: dehypoxanthine futalosine cyclase, partial [Candidatus Omnitrophica bacterium]|nr:dehypoxanthine futalosine cyclase [Candidatus Omnitrophota bacterium]
MSTIAEKVLAGERLTREDGRAILQEGDLLELGQLANTVRLRHNPDPVVTFVIDSNPNYTNVCITDCV